MDAKRTSFNASTTFGSHIWFHTAMVSFVKFHIAIWGAFSRQSLTLPDGGAHFLGDQEARPRRHASPVAILQRPDGD